MNDLFDSAGEETPRHTLHRKDAPETSITAAHTVDVGKMEHFVLSAVEAAGENGKTVKEITAENAHIPYPSISARPTALEKKGLIYYEGDKRDGARIIRASKFDKGFRVCPKCLGVLSKFYDMKCVSPRCKKQEISK